MKPVTERCRFITMLPGLGKTFLMEKFPREFLDLETFLKSSGLNYKETCRGNVALVWELLEEHASSAMIILSSIWWEDLGHKSDMFVTASRRWYKGEGLTERGRADLAKKFDDDTLQRWVASQHDYILGARIPYLMIRHSKEFVSKEVILANFRFERVSQGSPS